jgi:hypothetical protein
MSATKTIKGIQPIQGDRIVWNIWDGSESFATILWMNKQGNCVLVFDDGHNQFFESLPSGSKIVCK